MVRISGWVVAAAMHLLVGRHLPKARMIHPYQSNAFALDSRPEPYEVIRHTRICATAAPTAIG